MGRLNSCTDELHHENQSRYAQFVLRTALLSAVFACLYSGCSKKHAEKRPDVQAPKPSEKSWDPTRPIDLKSVPHHKMFVVIDRASLCPSKAQATANECGNSVEFADVGTLAFQGDIVTVVGNAPVGKHWRVVRFTKLGTLPSWILASAVDKRPIRSPFEQFQAKSSEAIDVGKFSHDQLAALQPGTKVVWQALSYPSIRYGAMQGPDDMAVYLEIARQGMIALDADHLRQHTGRLFARTHDCLLYGDCITLSYLCDETYCDQFFVEAIKTETLSAPPGDPEGEWPTAYSSDMPTFRVIRFADRFGLFVPKKQ